MKSREKGKKVVVLLLAGLLAGPAAATEVYKWVDENGVTHFSQTAPDPSVAGVSQKKLRDTTPSDYDPEQDIYGVEAQAERMKQMREDMDEKRQARLEREREAQKQQAVQYRDREYYGYPVYRPGWVDPHPPLRPTPPIARPPSGVMPNPPVARPPTLSGPGG